MEDLNHPKITRSPVVGRRSSGRFFRRAVISLIILAVICLLIFIVLKALGSVQSTAPDSSEAASAKYSYSHLSDSKVESSLTRIEFKRPQEFTAVQPAKQDKKLFNKEYAHTLPVDGKIAAIGGMAVHTLHPIISENPEVDINSAKKSFNEQNSSDYKKYTASLGIDSFLKSELSHLFFNNVSVSQVGLNIDKPSKLTTPNLKNNAWQFNFTAENKTAVGSSTGVSKIQGILIFALGKATPVYNAFDYVLIAGTESNWQSNQSIWQQIIDNIKIVELNSPTSD